jgi:quinol monooxygenase YgiN
MVIVAGYVAVEPQQRESYLAGCMSVVDRARGAAGRLDFAITADLIDPGRVNIFERSESQAAVEAFRRSALRNKQGAAMRARSSPREDLAAARPRRGTRRLPSRRVRLRDVLSTSDRIPRAAPPPATAPVCGSGSSTRAHPGGSGRCDCALANGGRLRRLRPPRRETRRQGCRPPQLDPLGRLRQLRRDHRARTLRPSARDHRPLKRTRSPRLGHRGAGRERRGGGGSWVDGVFGFHHFTRPRMRRLQSSPAGPRSSSADRRERRSRCLPVTSSSCSLDWIRASGLGGGLHSRRRVSRRPGELRPPARRRSGRGRG